VLYPFSTIIYYEFIIFYPLVSSSTFNKRFMNFSSLSFLPSTRLSIYARSMTMAYIFNGKIHHDEFFLFFFKKKQKIILKQEKKFITQYYPAFHIAFDVFLFFLLSERGKYESAVLKQAGRQHQKGSIK